MILFPFAEYWPFYIGFVAFVLGVLALDLGVFHRKAHEVSFKESSLWTLIWIGLALFFNYLFYLFVQMKFDVLTAKQSALEFLTGYVVEKSLAIDNIFIFAVVFAYFGIPKKYQHRILFWGILGALFFRALFIAMGSVLMTYQVIVLLLGTFLIFTGIKMFFAGTEEKDLKDNAIIKFLNKILRVHPKIAGQKFFIRKNNLFYVTPLFLALIFIEFTDIIFAIDSVPAIFSLTKEPLIVFTSNIFAILGLRSMYFMLAGFMEKFKYIKYGLAAVLIFVGSKMAFLNDLFGGKFPITWSLLIITGLIGSSILFSLWKSSREIEIEAK